MAVQYYSLYRNNSSSDNTYANYNTADPVPSITDTDWSNPGHVFVEWNTARNGSGTSYAPGDSLPLDWGTPLFAIWRELGAVEISYNNSSIASLSASGTEILETNGKLCTDDITITYTEPSAPIPTYQSKTVSPTTSSQTITADSGYDGLSKVTVNAISPTKTAQTYTPTTTDQTIQSGRWLTGNQIIKGDANLVASNIKSGVSIFGITGTNAGEDALANFIERRTAITSYANSTISIIASGAFWSCPKLLSVSFPSCRIIGSEAFYYCSSLASLSFPVCYSIGYNAFGTCRALTSVDFPAVLYIFEYAFYGCYSLSAISFPSCTLISKSAFQDCYSLTTVSFPVCTKIFDAAFNGCRNLAAAYFPYCTDIRQSAFRSCARLISLYLLGSSIASLSHSSAFSYTPIAGYTTSTGGVYGSIYVPSSLLASYKTATNWTYFSDRFVGI